MKKKHAWEMVFRCHRHHVKLIDKIILIISTHASYAVPENSLPSKVFQFTILTPCQRDGRA